MNGCLFCGLVEGKINAQIVYQDDRVVAFRDIKPQAPVHVLIIPRKHIAGVRDIEPEDQALIGQIFQVASRLSRDQGIA